MLRGPADVGEGPCGATRSHGDQPIAAIGCRAESRVGTAKRTESSTDVCGAGIGNVRSEQDDSASGIAPEGPAHSLAQIPAALWHGRYAHPLTHPGAIWGDGQNGSETAIPRKAMK